MRWGFIGAGHIATKALGPACHRANNSILQAVAAKDEARASKLEPIGHIYSDYYQILEDDEVDAIYISLPNDAHVPLSAAAIEGGKHVLCEKPLGMNAFEIDALSSLADSSAQLMVEASWNRWHPRTQRMAQLIHDAEIGQVTDIATGFVYQGTRPNNYRLLPEKGGGAIYDLGPYSIAALLWLTGFTKPSNLQTNFIWAPTGVDLDVIVTTNLGDVKARAEVSMNRPNDQWLRVTGTEGSLEMVGDQAFTSWQAPSQLKVEVKGDTRIEEFPAVDAYQLMLESFADRAQGGDSWVMPMKESLSISSLFDQIFATAR